MDLLLILTYAAICVFIFKVFRIPLTKWTVPTAVLGGVILIGGLLLVMNYNHPFSEVVRQYYTTTPIIPEVKGRVIDVQVKMNVPVKAGDVLFRIDPQPFQDEIDGIKGSLTAAVKELKRSESLITQGATSHRDLDSARSRVEELESQLANAEFDLEQTVVKAPGDGMVTQLNLRQGMMALPLAARPVMTFLHEQEGIFIGWFRQNSLLRIKKNDEAEVVLDALPGVTLKAQVDFIFPAIGEGQMQPAAEFMRFAQQTMPGRVAVALRITDPSFDHYNLPSGLYGQAAIYTEHFHHVGLMRKILLRMAAWMNYVFPMH
jgi:multidrug resistance efflux pump